MIQEPRGSEAMDGPDDGDGGHSTSRAKRRAVFTPEVPIDQQKETVPSHQSVLGGYEREDAIFKDERASPTSWLSTLPLDMLTYYMSERYLRPKPAVTRWSINHLFKGRNVPALFQAMGSYIRVREFAVRGPNAYFSATLNFPDYAAGLFVIIVSAERTEPRVVKLDILPESSLICGTDSEHSFRFDLVNGDTEFCVTVFQDAGNLIAFFSLDGARTRTITPLEGNANITSLPTLHHMPWLSGNQIAYYDHLQDGNIICRGFDVSSFRQEGIRCQDGTRVGFDTTLYAHSYGDAPFLGICETGILMLAPVADVHGEPKLPEALRRSRRGREKIIEHDCCSPDGSYVLRTSTLDVTKVYIFETWTRRVLTSFDPVDWHQRSINGGMAVCSDYKYCGAFGCCLIDNNHYCSVIWDAEGVTVEMRG